MLPLLQDAGHATLNVVLPAVVQAAALALLIGAIDLTLGRRLRASLRQALWLLVVLKLILPPALELPTSAAYWMGRLALKPREIRAVTGLPPNLSAAWEMVPAEPPPLAPLHSYGFRKATDPSSLLLLLWITGSAALAAVIFRRQRRVQNLLRSATAPTPALESLLTQASTEAGLSKRPQLLLTSENHSPAVCGLLHPTLLLPRSLADAVSPEVLRNVLLHELIHIRRRDLWVNALQVGVQVLWWWNPIAWFANARVRALRELAVDEQVQHLHGPQNPTAYPAALVEVARHCSAQPMLALSFVGILESNRTLKQRVERLLTHPTPTHPQLGGSGWITILALALLVVPMGFSPRVRIVAAINPTPAAAVGTPTPLEIECLPGERFQLGDQAFDLGTLTEELKRRSSGAPNFVLSLRSAPDAPMAGILEAVKAAQSVGITRINIQTDPVKPGNAPPAGDLPVPQAGRDQIRARLDSIRLSDLRFSGTPLADAVKELALRSRVADPAGLGFNYIIDLGPEDPGDAPHVTWLQPIGDLAVSEILKQFVANADRPLKYAIEDYAVVFRSAARPEEPSLFTRRFKVARRVLVPNLERELGKPIGTNPPDAGSALRTYLSQHGLTFAEGPSEAAPPQNQPAMFYNDRTGILFVRATEPDHQKLATLLARIIESAPQQILLETKILDVSRDASSELQLTSDTANIQTGPGGSSASFILRPADARKLMARLDAIPSVTQMAAPNIVTLSARQASIRIHPPNAASASDSEDVVLDLLPAIRADTGHIALTVVGFGPGISGGQKNPKPSAGEAPQVAYTNMEGIPDQHTAVLMGMVTTLPNGTQRHRILMITPTLIDMAGHPVNPKL